VLHVEPANGIDSNPGGAPAEGLWTLTASQTRRAVVLSVVALFGLVCGYGMSNLVRFAEGAVVAFIIALFAGLSALWSP